VKLEALEETRAAARKAVRDADELARAARTQPPAKARKAILALENALVEVKKHHAMAFAYQKWSSHRGPAEQLDVQRKFVEEISAGLERLQWTIAQRRAAAAIREASEALNRTRASAERAATLSPKAFAHRAIAIAARLDREMEATMKRVAVTIADEKRFAATHAGMLEPGNEPMFAARPADVETMASALAAQKAAVDDLKRRLWDTNERVEAIKRATRI
jgi:hypothetical protein